MFTRGLDKERSGNATSLGHCECVCPGAHRLGARVFFAVYAPQAERVFLVGSFNGWGDSHPMTSEKGDIWVTDISSRDIKDGDTYKFKICKGGCEIYVTDPYAVENGGPPHFNSVYRDISDELSHTYENEEHFGCLGMPLNIYEIRADLIKQGGKASLYCDIARDYTPYILQMGYTHVCLSGVFECYYDHAHSHGEQAYFAPHRDQGGVDGLRSLVHSMHASGIGVLLDWVVEHIPEDATGERFLADNALYWLDTYGIDGFLIGGGAVRGDALSRLIREVRSEREEAYFITRDFDIYGSVAGINAAVRDCDAYASGAMDVRALMAARAYLIFLDGKTITYSGCELEVVGEDAIKQGIDPSLSERRENAFLQLFTSDLSELYLSHECLWACDRRVKVTRSRDGYIAVIECSSGEDRLILAVDLSGRGGDVKLPCAAGTNVLLDTPSQRYGARRGNDLHGDTVTLEPFGAVALG